jgi:glycosyltransferase involved in cell wall biosynthesis
MPLISIIIVNYRVPYFLEQCLQSVRVAARDLEAEVIVVDNASGDGSIEYLRPRFPEVRFLESATNLGFARASNRGYRESKGEYILFLNPDTLISEDSLRAPVRFIQDRPEAGALGIRMIDGMGKFLPESKRAFPDPITAFYKIIGLSRLFPRSPRFARYHLGHLSADDNQVVDVVSGAFFLVRRSVVEQVGVFDEQFFMYGEDVDLSYRIQTAGYTNYYFAESSILHFKGESTQKQALRYVRLFYGAMSQFVRKHQLHNGFFTAGIQVAIGLRALASLMRRTIQRIGVPVLDWLLILGSFFGVRAVWSDAVRPDVVYPSALRLSTSLYALLFFLAALIAGLYRSPFRWKHLFRATLIATGTVLMIYSLLPEQLRYSRGMILFSAVFSALTLMGWRRLLLSMQVINPNPSDLIRFPILIIGSSGSVSAIRSFYPEQPAAAFQHLELGSRSLEELVRSTHALIPFQEIVFSPGELSYQQMLLLMQRLSVRYTFRFHVPGSDRLIYSNFQHKIG